MLKLRPYNPSDAQKILSWISDETAFRKWSADRYPKYPITPDEMNAFYNNADENFFGMTAFDESGVRGHLTMRFMDKEKNHVRFGFIIVDCTIRKKGYGKQMLALALEYAFRILHAEKVSLGVFENNQPAYFCYNAAGFKSTGDVSSCRILNEDWNCLELAVTKEEYFS